MTEPTQDNEPLVRVRDLTVSFGNTEALSQLNLDIAVGSSVALVGANGSGKTTLLNVFAGLVQPSSGTLEMPQTPRAAYVLQHQQADRWLPLTVTEVLRMGLYAKAGLFGRITASDRTRLGEAAAELDVSGLLQQQFGELSGGQRQRVLIAQALLQASDLLLLDEPITGLDLPSQQTILELIDTCAERDRTIVLSTHHLDEARHCDVVVLLAKSVVAVGSPAQTLTRPNLRKAFGERVLGDHQGHDHAEDLLVLDHHGHGDHGH